MDIGLNWNEWHQEAARKPYVRVGVTLLSGALILMPAQEIVSLYLEKNLISEIEVCATPEDINVSGNDLPEKVTIEAIQTDVNQADVIQVAAVLAEILVEEPMVEEIVVEEPVVEEIVAEKPGVKRDTTINVASEPVITNPDSIENVKNENEDEEGSIAVGNTDTGYLINAEGMICGLSGDKEVDCQHFFRQIFLGYFSDIVQAFDTLRKNVCGDDYTSLHNPIVLSSVLPAYGMFHSIQILFL